jgi:hypothetical protein
LKLIIVLENGVLSPFITGSYKPDGISETAETLSSITDKYSLDEKTRKVGRK